MVEPNILQENNEILMTKNCSTASQETIIHMTFSSMIIVPVYPDSFVGLSVLEYVTHIGLMHKNVTLQEYTKYFSWLI